MNRSGLMNNGTSLTHAFAQTERLASGGYMCDKE